MHELWETSRNCYLPSSVISFTIISISCFARGIFRNEKGCGSEWSGVLQHFWLEVVSLIVSAFCDAKIYVHEVFPAFAKSNHFSFQTRENSMQLVFVPKSQPKLFPFISFRSSYLMRGKSCAGIESWENKSRDPRLCIDNWRRCGINEPIYPSCYQCGASTSRQAIPLRSG